MSDLVPVICIVFEQTIKTAPRMDLLRVARFVKPACAVRNEDSRYKIGHDWMEWNDYMYIIHEQKPARTSCFCPIFFLFSKFEGFSNRAYIYKLTDIFWISSFKFKVGIFAKVNWSACDWWETCWRSVFRHKQRPFHVVAKRDFSLLFPLLCLNKLLNKSVILILRNLKLIACFLLLCEIF